MPNHNRIFVYPVCIQTAFIVQKPLIANVSFMIRKKKKRAIKKSSFAIRMSLKRTINSDNGNTFVTYSEKLINGSIVFNPNWINSDEMLIWPVYRVFLMLRIVPLIIYITIYYHYYFVKENKFVRFLTFTMIMKYVIVAIISS